MQQNALTFEKKWYNRGREGENYAAQQSPKIDLRSIRQRCLRKRTGKVLFSKHLFNLSFAEASERNRKLRNSDESAWKEAQIVRCRSSAHPLSILIWSTGIAFVRSLSERIGVYMLGFAVGALSGLIGLIKNTISGEFLDIRKANKQYWTVCFPLYLLYRFFFLLSISTAETREQALTSGLLRDLWPLMTFISAVIVFQQKVTIKFCFCLIISFVGVMIASFDWKSWLFPNELFRPCLFAFLSSVTWGLYSCFTRKYSNGCDYSGIFMLASSIISLIPAVAFRQLYFRFTVRVGLELLYSAVFMTFLATVCWNTAMKKGNFILIIILSNFLPLITVLLSSLILGVHPSMQMLLGSSFIILGTLFGKSGVRAQRDRNKNGGKL